MFWPVQGHHPGGIYRVCLLIFANYFTLCIFILIRYIIWLLTGTYLTQFAVLLCLCIILHDDDLVEVSTCWRDVSNDCYYRFANCWIKYQIIHNYISAVYLRCCVIAKLAASFITAFFSRPLWVTSLGGNFMYYFTRNSAAITWILPGGHYMHHHFNTHKFSVLPTRCVYVFYVDRRTNSDLYGMIWYI
jgi:hypothetical protein